MRVLLLFWHVVCCTLLWMECAKLCISISIVMLCCWIDNFQWICEIIYDVHIFDDFRFSVLYHKLVVVTSFTSCFWLIAKLASFMEIIALEAPSNHDTMKNPSYEIRLLKSSGLTGTSMKILVDRSDFFFIECQIPFDPPDKLGKKDDEDSRRSKRARMRERERKRQKYGCLLIGFHLPCWTLISFLSIVCHLACVYYIIGSARRIRDEKSIWNYDFFFFFSIQFVCLLL